MSPLIELNFRNYLTNNRITHVFRKYFKNNFETQFSKSVIKLCLIRRLTKQRKIPNLTIYFIQKPHLMYGSQNFITFNLKKNKKIITFKLLYSPCN